MNKKLLVNHNGFLTSDSPSIWNLEIKFKAKEVLLWDLICEPNSSYLDSVLGIFLMKDEGFLLCPEIFYLLSAIYNLVNSFMGVNMDSVDFISDSTCFCTIF